MGLLPEWLEKVEEFEWDEGNRDKNWEKHRVPNGQAEEVFFHRPLLFFESGQPSLESRYLLLGQSGGGRKLAVVFTVRGKRVRVISARDMSRKERGIYEGSDQ